MSPLAIGNLKGEVEARVVFAGYGITADRFDYDDYANVDAAGAIVIILEGEPQASDPISRFAGTKDTVHARFVTKVINAMQHGASAVIFVGSRASIDKNRESVQDRIDGELARKKSISQQLSALPKGLAKAQETLRKKLAAIDSMVSSLEEDRVHAARGVLGIADAGQRPENQVAVPVISLARDVIDQILQNAGRDSIDEIEQQIDESVVPVSFEIDDVTTQIKISQKPNRVASNNVIGVLPGKGDLADESVVIGAHYDHVGMGGEGSLAPETVEVHNGADDNASGVAALLAVADSAKKSLADVTNHRRIVFIGFTGEERGLAGSRFYVRNPRFALESTAVMLNMDMIGRLRDNDLTVLGMDTGDTLPDFLRSANEKAKFNLVTSTTAARPSDHLSFYERNVPVLFFFTGLHNDYHRPSDDSAKIDYQGLSRVSAMVHDVAMEAATRTERPMFRKLGDRSGIRVVLGLRLEDHVTFAKVLGVDPAGSAKRAGVRQGDRITKLDDRSVGSLAEVLNVLRKKTPGDEMKLQLMRGDQNLDVTVKLDGIPVPSDTVGRPNRPRRRPND